MSPATPTDIPPTEPPSAPETAAILTKHPLLRVPVEARGVGIAIIATVALVWALSWAQSFFVSLLMGILIAYTLNPLVSGLQRLKLPRVLATTIVMVGVLCALGFGGYSLRGQIQTIINQLPTASSKLSAGLASFRYSQRRIVQKVQSAANVFENVGKPKVATPAPAPPPPALPKPVEDAATANNDGADTGRTADDNSNSGENNNAGDNADSDNRHAETHDTARAVKVNPVVVAAPPAPMQFSLEQPSFKLSHYLWAGSMGAISFLGQVAAVIFLVFFLLLNSDTFRQKLVRIAGTSLSKKKITVTILDDINRSVQRYMFMQLTTNVLVGLLTWVVFRAIGLENAGAWAVVAGVLHIVPYLGPAVTAGLTGMAAYMQFNSFSPVLLVAGASLIVATLIGTFVTTWMTGRIAKMNTAGVFISLLFWGWLWGIWGMLLSIPIIVIVKVISQQVEPLHPVAELLGE